MTGRKAKIEGMGFYVPDRILTNYELEHMVETTDKWITERSGIKERRILEKERTNTEMAVIAARRALENSGIGAGDIDLIITATITPDYFTPSCSCMVQEKIGAVNAAAFDVNAACSGFIYGMSVATQYIASGTYDNILVIGNEGLSKIIDWEHRSTCVLFGDGAGAAVLTESDKKGIIDFDLGAVGELGMAITAPCNHFSPEDIAARGNERRHVIRMDGREVFKFATRKMAESVETLLDKNGMDVGDVDLIIPHQANIRILQTAAKKLGIGMEKIYSVIDRYGNTSSASIPIAMCEAFSEGRIKKGDTIVMTGFGGGLTWASVLMEWV